MKKIAVFPGSFDPFTIGHEQIVRKATPMFDELVVAIGVNSRKDSSMYSLATRLQWIKDTFADEPKITVAHYEGLTINFCHSIGAHYLVRGLRNTIDFEFEFNIANMNKAMAADIETVCLFTSPEVSAINSTIVRDIIKNGGNAQPFVPPAIKL